MWFSHDQCTKKKHISFNVLIIIQWKVSAAVSHETQIQYRNSRQHAWKAPCFRLLARSCAPSFDQSEVASLRWMWMIAGCWPLPSHHTEAVQVSIMTAGLAEHTVVFYFKSFTLIVFLRVEKEKKKTPEWVMQVWAWLLQTNNKHLQLVSGPWPAVKAWSEIRRRVIRVNKVGGELPLPLHIHFSSESDAVSHSLNHLGRLLGHLRARKWQ